MRSNKLNTVPVPSFISINHSFVKSELCRREFWSDQPNQSNHTVRDVNYISTVLRQSIEGKTIV